jgi:hypothetical protein
MASYRRFRFHARRNRVQSSEARPDGELPLRRLVLCRDCGRDFVALIDALECDDGSRWAVMLRCGACETQRLLLVSTAELDALLNELEWNALTMEADAVHLWRERTADEIEIFVTALERDLIGTDDFGH